jgi:hypothetical protein
MSCLEGLVRDAARSFEPELKSRLQGFLGGFVQAYLPQVWVFRTDDGTVSLAISKDGTPTVSSGALPHPDVTIEIPHDRLRAALKERRREAVPPGPLKVTTHTAKGKTAFDFLKGRLGF